MITKRKKNSRLRGSKTHAWGSRKKHRGAGNRGGKGLSGSGKRGDAKKPTMLKNKRVFGKHGFTTKRRTFITSVNIRYIEDRIESLVKKGLAQKKAGSFVLDLSSVGADKLIAKGTTTRKYEITCKAATSGAKSAIEAAGGKVILSEDNKAVKDKEE